jgi:hypothetical protein
MSEQLIKRAKSFAWRAGAFVSLAVFTYLANVSDIREIDFVKLATIFTVTISAYIVSEITKFYNV